MNKRFIIKGLIATGLDQEKLKKRFNFEIRHMKPVWIKKNLKNVLNFFKKKHLKPVQVSKNKKMLEKLPSSKYSCLLGFKLNTLNKQADIKFIIHIQLKISGNILGSENQEKNGKERKQKQWKRN